MRKLEQDVDRLIKVTKGLARELTKAQEDLATARVLSLNEKYQTDSVVWKDDVKYHFYGFEKGTKHAYGLMAQNVTAPLYKYKKDGTVGKTFIHLYAWSELPLREAVN